MSTPSNTPVNILEISASGRHADSVSRMLTRDLMTELLDEHRLRFDLSQELGRELFQFPVILGQCHRFSRHGQSLHHWICGRNPNPSAKVARYVRACANRCLPEA